jgi:hypothetical protein
LNNFSNKSERSPYIKLEKLKFGVCSVLKEKRTLIQNVMLTDASDIGDVTITNDGATILKMLEVEHPTANGEFRFIVTNSTPPCCMCTWHLDES